MKGNQFPLGQPTRIPKMPVEKLCLTKTETLVLELSFKGVTPKEIAALQHRSPKTIQRHIENMLLATGAKNKMELCYEALARGWLQPPRKLAI